MGGGVYDLSCPSHHLDLQGGGGGLRNVCETRAALVTSGAWLVTLAGLQVRTNPSGLDVKDSESCFTPPPAPGCAGHPG